MLLISFCFLSAQTIKDLNYSTDFSSQRIDIESVVDNLPLLASLDSNEEALKGGYYYMSLQCRHKRTGDNYSVITPVFYSSKRPRVSDLMKYVSNNFDYLTYSSSSSAHVWGRYTTKSKASRSRADNIQSSKRYKHKIKYVRFTGY